MDCEDLLIGLPVLQHLHVDTKTLLENNIKSLEGTDCTLPENDLTKTGKLNRLMTARLNLQLDRGSDVSQTPGPLRLKVN